MNSQKALKICLVAPFEGGKFADDSIGSYYNELIRDLSKRGHNVKVLCTDNSGGKGVSRFWKHEGKLINLETIPSRFDTTNYESRFHTHSSYDTFLYLREKDFDVIAFPEWHAIGFYTLLAKHQNLSFQDVFLQVLSFGPSDWRNQLNQIIPDSANDLIVSFMEKKCVNLADSISFLKEEHLEWMKSNNWALPSDIKLISDVETLLANWTKPAPDAIEPTTKLELPLVSVCMAHRNRPHFLRQAIKSIEEQTYPSVEFVLVDDGSDTPEALAMLDQLDPVFDKRGWKIVRQENSYLGKARNVAAQHASGEYLLFMDDDNYADPVEISRLIRVAKHTRADIVTCAMRLFSGDEQPGLDTNSATYREPCLGAAPEIGLYFNCFGDANSLIRSSVFNSTDGFPEDRNYAYSDWEFFARCVLDGIHLEWVPEPLFWYRQGHSRMCTETSEYLNRINALRPYKETELKPLHAVLAHGINLRRERLEPLARQQFKPSLRAQSLLNNQLKSMREEIGQVIVDMKYMLTNTEEDTPEQIETYSGVLACLEELLDSSRIEMNHMDSPASYNIDLIQGKRWRGDTKELKLTVADTFSLEGWAFDGKEGKLAADVILLVDEEVVAHATYGLSRSDVAQFYGISDIDCCGFIINFACSSLKPGKHEVSFRIISHDLSYYYEPTKFVLCIEELQFESQDVESKQNPISQNCSQSIL